ncbi:MAG: glycosyltransferase [Desulfobacteraceae bacterium]|nr:glycosyltransferase [Desulfobacteraceae bacterium]
MSYCRVSLCRIEKSFFETLLFHNDRDIVETILFQGTLPPKKKVEPVINIMHIVTTLSSGGAEAALYRLLSQTSRDSSFEHRVVSLTGIGIYGPYLRKLGIPVYSLGMKPGRPKLRSLSTLYRLIKQDLPDILQTWLYHADLVGLLAGSLSGVNRIVWNVRCTNVDFQYYAPTTRWVFSLLSRLSRLPTAVIANSYEGKNFHRRSGYRPKKWKVIPNGFDTRRYWPNPKARSQFRAILGLDDSARIIGMVARYDPMKDHANFFAAAARVSAVFPNVRFVLCGRDMSRHNSDIKKMIQENNLMDKTYLLGERSDLPDIFPALDINTLSSSFAEGFPNVLGEAMACGVPCISTNVGDAARIIGDTGKVVRPRDPVALAEASLDLLSNSGERRRELGLRARKRIEGRFSISKMAREYGEFYLEIMQ